MIPYIEDNVFVITKEDVYLYSKMQDLFKIIQKCDRVDSKTLLDNTFTWLSEDYGPYENANKLIIEFKDNSFIIKFYQNLNREFNIEDICSICFCLNGSKNQDIASAFSLMFLDFLKEYSNPNERILK